MGSLDDEIIKVLKRHRMPLSPSSIALLIGAPKDRVSKKVRKLEKYGYIQLATVKKMRFYKLKKW